MTKIKPAIAKKLEAKGYKKIICEFCGDEDDYYNTPDLKMCECKAKLCRDHCPTNHGTGMKRNK